MAYNTALPPALIAGKLNSGPRIWMYEEAGLASAAVDLSGYITNAYTLGMRNGDLVFHRNPTTNIWSSHVVVNTPTAASPAADLSNGTTIADGSSNSD